MVQTHSVHTFEHMKLIDITKINLQNKGCYHINRCHHYERALVHICIYRHGQITTPVYIQISQLPYHFHHLVSKVFYTAVSLSHHLVWGQVESHVLLSQLPRGTYSHPVTDTHSLRHIPLDTVTPMHAMSKSNY